MEVGQTAEAPAGHNRVAQHWLLTLDSSRSNTRLADGSLSWSSHIHARAERACVLNGKTRKGSSPPGSFKNKRIGQFQQFYRHLLQHRRPPYTSHGQLVPVKLSKIDRHLISMVSFRPVSRLCMCMLRSNAIFNEALCHSFMTWPAERFLTLLLSRKQSQNRTGNVLSLWQVYQQSTQCAVGRNRCTVKK